MNARKHMHTSLPHALAVLTLAFPLIAQSQPAPNEAAQPAQQSSEDRAAIAERIRAHLEATDFSGAMLVQRANQTIYRSAHGTRDAATDTPLTPDTLFETASTTKLITKLVLLRLHEEGLLKLDDPMQAHLPPDVVPEPWHDVTIRQLMSHTSGIPGGGSGRGADLNHAAHVHLDQPPAFTPPGSAYRYSNAAFAVLAAIIEHTTAASYEQACRTYVLEPAGIADRTIFCEEPTDLPLAHASRGIGRPANRDPYPTPQDTVYGGEYKGMGGWCASVDALAALHTAILDARIVSPEHRDMLFEPLEVQPTACLFHERFVFPDTGQLCYAVGGAVSGFTSKLWWFPQSQTLIVLLSNDDPRSFNWSSLTGVKAIAFDER